MTENLPRRFSIRWTSPARSEVAAAAPVHSALRPRGNVATTTRQIVTAPARGAKVARGLSAAPQLLTAAQKLAPAVDGFHRTTHSRRKIATQLWYLCKDKRAPERTFAALLHLAYAPSSAVTLGLSASGAIPELKDNSEWVSALRWLRKVGGASSHLKKQAVPLSPAHLSVVAAHFRSSAEARTAAVLLISASRHADLAQVKVTHIWPTRSRHWLVMRVAFPAFKSDLFGQREVSKVLEVPSSIAPALMRSLRNPVSYRKLYNFLKGIDTSLTPHSLRRTATTLLAAAEVEPSQTVLLTAHTTTTEVIAIRKYADPQPNAAEARVQRRLSRWLCSQLPMNFSE
jgi:integrase